MRNLINYTIKYDSNIIRIGCKHIGLINHIICCKNTDLYMNENGIDYVYLRYNRIYTFDYSKKYNFIMGYDIYYPTFVLDIITTDGYDFSYSDL